MLIVAAAGNDGCACLHVPAAMPAVLAVGAMDDKGEPIAAPTITSVEAGIAAGNWYHVAMSRAGNRPGNTKLYINGIQNDNQAAIGSVKLLSNTYLGGQPDVPDSCFQGKLLEVRVWRYGRSQAEIQANMCYYLTYLTGRQLGLIRC